MRRGYFVEGLGGAQFALPAAIERLRGLRSDEPAGPLVLAATDPANPYGAALPWPKRDDARRPQRAAGALVVTLDSEPVLYVERSGKGLISLADPFADGPDAPAVAVAAPSVADGAGRRGAGPRAAATGALGPPPTAAWLDDALAALAGHVRAGHVKRLAIERFDGDPVVGSPFEPALVAAGFALGPRRLTLSA